MTKIFYYMFSIVLVFQPVYSMTSPRMSRARPVGVKTQIPGTMVRITNKSGAQIQVYCHDNEFIEQMLLPEHVISLSLGNNFNHDVPVVVSIPESRQLFAVNIPKGSITNVGDYVITVEDIDRSPKLKITCQEHDFNRVFNLIDCYPEVPRQG